MELIKFIFSDFWIWFGFVLLVVFTLDGIQGIVRQIKRK